MKALMTSVIPVMSIVFIATGTFSGCDDKAQHPDAVHIAYIAQNCYGCHNPAAPEEQRIAPSLGEITAHYKTRFGDEEAFREAITGYIANPGTKNSQNPAWVEKYGVMPRMSFTESRLNEALRYMYNHNFESEEWKSEWSGFLADSDKINKLLNRSMSPMEVGLQSAMKTKSALGSQLMQALKTRGAAGAVTFCNEKAQPITNQMAEELDVKVKRVSDRARNPLNQANEEQLKIIEQYKKDLATGKKLKGVLIEKDGRSIAHFPIRTNQMCMQCHGMPGSEIKPETQNAIRERYPDDEATGYRPGQLRGLFVVEMD